MARQLHYLWRACDGAALPLQCTYAFNGQRKMNNTFKWAFLRCHFSSSRSQGHGGAMENDFTSCAVRAAWVEMSNAAQRRHTCQTSEEGKEHLFLTPSCLWGQNHQHLSLPSGLQYYTPALHKVCLPKLIQGPLEALFQNKVLATLLWLHFAPFLPL